MNNGAFVHHALLKAHGGSVKRTAHEATQDDVTARKLCASQKEQEAARFEATTSDGWLVVKPSDRARLKHWPVLKLRPVGQ
eukprot:CAMPEP_0179893702 /NCGR_PEP_ID=MMETSP0982-20121206/34909_1 /TAXON_ID=483367 /ORGANISM="non described non described, Strain CCMP 2436" /LENGTH=80 /DNA_ID=CAMNT_0021790275 /DNA_START=30 /DNA_END=273 /DNA_ORIENTATION=-